MDPIVQQINACRTEQDLISVLTKSGIAHVNAVGIVKRIGVLTQQEKRVLMKLADLRDSLRIAA
tara:strand:- start:39555 stop:39746 length:192 start_codon:yes stop_codon:yes gene_type:complete